MYIFSAKILSLLHYACVPNSLLCHSLVAKRHHLMVIVHSDIILNHRTYSMRIWHCTYIACECTCQIHGWNQLFRNRIGGFGCPKHPDCVHYNPWNQDTSVVRTLLSVSRVHISIREIPLHMYFLLPKCVQIVEVLLHNCCTCVHDGAEGTWNSILSREVINYEVWPDSVIWMSMMSYLIGCTLHFPVGTSPTQSLLR